MMARNSPPFGVGVIGLGVGERLALTFARHPDCRLVALCDTDETKLDTVSERYPDAGRHAEASSLIADKDVDIVAVASPDDLHHGHILEALRAGKHVFSEKPVVTAREHAIEIRDALRANPALRMTTNTILRMSPRFRSLRHDIAANRLGSVYYVEADYNYGRLHKLTEGWRGRIADYSVMLGGGIHMIDLVLWLTGRKAVEVTAMGGNRNSQGTTFQGDDLTVALVRFDDGALAKIGANFGCVEPHFHRLTIYGTLATFENGREHAFLWESRDPAIKPRAISTDYPGVDKGDMVPAFIDAVAGRGRAMIEEDEVFAALSVGFAIDRAKRIGQTVSVEQL